MKKIIVLAFAAISCFGQAAFPTTTLTFATTKKDPGPISVASVANIFGPNNFTGNTIILIDQEAMCVNRVLNKVVHVERGCQGTWTQNHAVGATVYAGFTYQYKQIPPGGFGGTCVAANYPVLPWIVLPGASIWNCTNGVWVVTGGGGFSAKKPQTLLQKIFTFKWLRFKRSK